MPAQHNPDPSATLSKNQDTSSVPLYPASVSYTHLDVYKRQVLNRADVKGRAYGKYGYGKYGYGYGYGYGYEPKDKKNSSDSAATDKNSTGK